VSIRNTLSEEMLQGGLKIRIISRLVGRTYRQAGGIVAVSRGVADDFAATAHVDRGRITVIYNPVVSEELWEKAEQPLDDLWFAPGQPPVVLAVGRLAPQKDFATLLRAFAVMRNRKPARLLILGEGSERNALTALAVSLGVSDDVRMPGFVDNPYPYMRRAHLFVLSSRHEGLPAVLIEAAALGLPIVSTDCRSGPDEILEGGKWGKLVPVGDADRMAAAMIEALDAPGPSPRSRGTEFTVQRAVEKYLRLIPSSKMHAALGN
jgi:glycosyltransferase involved in cell wall biosynthesis